MAAVLFAKFGTVIVKLPVSLSPYIESNFSAAFPLPPGKFNIKDPFFESPASAVGL